MVRLISVWLKTPACKEEVVEYHPYMIPVARPATGFLHLRKF